MKTLYFQMFFQPVQSMQLLYLWKIRDFFLISILTTVLKYVLCKLTVRREDLINFCLKSRILFMEFWRKIVSHREYMYTAISDFSSRHRLNVSGHSYCLLPIDTGDNKMEITFGSLGCLTSI